jgi:nucleotide-binding universal stress UspA family protein
MADAARILVGIDGSEPAEVALRWAADEAARWDGVLEVVYAWLPPYPLNPQDLFEDEGGEQETARRALADSAARLRAERSDDLEIRELLVSDHPAKALIDASRGAALLVVGSRGRGGFKGLLLGSVSLQCVHHASCPVVVVRPARPD